jgi:hypothetical protein
MFSSNTTQESGGYQIQRSLRFNSADTAYLGRTPATASNRRTWTWSGWVKRSGFNTDSALFTCFFANNDNSNFALLFNSANQLSVGLNSISAFQTTPVYRDPSGWYHVVLAVDTTQATAANRMSLYVNGVQVTAFATNNLASISQNTELGVNTANAHLLGAMNQVGWLYPGYMTEVNFIDGQALTPSSFGAFDAQTGVWGPIPYAGTYGTNGFYLNFSNNSNTTAATLGADYSGNGNNWTPNNFSVTAGAGNDSLVDVPTNWGVDTGVGGSVRGNYCTGNPLDVGSGITFSNGNLDYTGVTADQTARSTVGVATGKWYWEVTPTSATSRLAIGIVDAATSGNSAYVGQTATSYSYYSLNGNKYNNATNASYGAAFDLNDVIGVALDMDAGTLVFYKNGTSQGTAYTGITGTKIPAVSNGVSSTQTCAFNFGQRPFAYTAPSGFKALNTQNLPNPTIGATPTTQANKYFDATLFTGTGSPLTVVNAGGFQPDLVWTKNRSSVANHLLTNVLSGVSQYLSSNDTTAELTGTQLYTSFNSNGFSMGTSGYPNGAAVVAWQWRANGAGVTNTAGTITSTVSANTTSGFSVVTYTGTGANATVGHGLGAAAQMVIVKRRNATANWQVRHTAIAAANSIQLNLVNAAASATTVWNSTNPTSTVFSIGTDTTVNASGGTYVAYAFAEVPGYSRFGSYTGNGSTDGPFVFTGFRPAYVMLKRSDQAYDWWVFDGKRPGYNVTSNRLAPNLSDAEYTSGTIVDFTANGFKIRDASQGWNGSGGTIVFAAFAEAPQKFALAR